MNRALFLSLIFTASFVALADDRECEGRIAPDVLIRGFHRELQKFKPTRVTPDRMVFNNIAWVGESPVSIAVYRHGEYCIKGPEVEVFALREGARWSMQAAPGNGGNGEHDAIELFRIVRDQMAVTNRDPLRSPIEAWVKQHQTILVPQRMLQPEHFARSQEKLASALVRASIVPAVVEIPFGVFVNTIARALRAYYPALTEITGQEKTWEELRRHGGIDASNFDRYFQPDLRRGDEPSLSFEHLFGQPRIDHGHDPVRNGPQFHISRDGARGYRLQIVRDGMDPTALDAYLRMIDIFTSNAIPVTVSESFLHWALGEEKESVLASDPRLKDQIQMADYPELQLPELLSEGEARVLLDFDQFFTALPELK